MCVQKVCIVNFPPIYTETTALLLMREKIYSALPFMRLTLFLAFGGDVSLSPHKLWHEMPNNYKL